MEYTRPATWEDVKTLARYLNESGTEYALGGGYAIAAHGFNRFSEDFVGMTSIGFCPLHGHAAVSSQLQQAIGTGSNLGASCHKAGNSPRHLWHGDQGDPYDEPVA